MQTLGFIRALPNKIFRFLTDRYYILIHKENLDAFFSASLRKKKPREPADIITTRLLKAAEMIPHACELGGGGIADRRVLSPSRRLTVRRSHRCRRSRRSSWYRRSRRCRQSRRSHRCRWTRRSRQSHPNRRSRRIRQCRRCRRCQRSQSRRGQRRRCRSRFSRRSRRGRLCGKN